MGWENLKRTKRKDGYEVVWYEGKIQYVHRLVGKKYIPNPENKPTINHINGIKDDNRVENLEWATYKENNNHARDTGLWGENIIHKRKLTPEQVKEIRNKYIPRKYTQKMLSEEYDIDQGTISRIIKNKTYTKNK